jgi:hypothetical protein
VALLLLSIPFMILGLAVATIPVLLGMRAESRVEANRRRGQRAFRRNSATRRPDLGPA